MENANQEILTLNGASELEKTRMGNGLNKHVVLAELLISMIWR